MTPLLAGNCRTFLLACVSPHAGDYLDSLNTLRIASRAQGIKVTHNQSNTNGSETSTVWHGGHELSMLHAQWTKRLCCISNKCCARGLRHAHWSD